MDTVLGTERSNSMNRIRHILGTKAKTVAIACLTLLALAPTGATADSYEITSRADLINFISAARADTLAAQQFIEHLEQWGVKVEQDQKKYFGSILTSNVNSTGLTFRGASVTGSILLTRGGIEQIKVSLTPMVIPHDPNLEGICSVLSVLHSLHDKLKLIPALGESDYPDNVSYDLLVEAKNATSKPNTEGASSKEMKLIYEHFAHKAGKEIICTDDNEMSGSTEDERKASCEKLQGLLKDEDCDLVMDWPGDGYGHAATITSAKYSGGKCVVEVTNTGSQGIGHGIGVPTEPGTYRMTIEPFVTPRGYVHNTFSSVTNLGYISGSDDDKPFMPRDLREYYSRESKKMTAVSYFCCRSQDSL